MDVAVEAANDLNSCLDKSVLYPPNVMQRVNQAESGGTFNVHEHCCDGAEACFIGSLQMQEIWMIANCRWLSGTFAEQWTQCLLRIVERYHLVRSRPFRFIETFHAVLGGAGYQRRLQSTFERTQ